MKRTQFVSMLVAAACAVAATGLGGNLAQAADQQRERAQEQARERIYGSQLMTQQERNEYRLRMRELKTQQEREQFRKEHHERMKERARERGLTLPDEPPARGQGMGPRHGDAPGRSVAPGPGAGPASGGSKGR